MKRVWNILFPCICLLLGLVLGYGIARTRQAKEPADTLLTPQDYQLALERISVSGTGGDVANPSGSVWVDKRSLQDGLRMELTGIANDGMPVQMSLSTVHKEGLPDGVRLLLPGSDVFPEASLHVWYEDAHGGIIAERTLQMTGSAEKAN